MLFSLGFWLASNLRKSLLVPSQIVKLWRVTSQKSEGLYYTAAEA